MALASSSPAAAVACVLLALVAAAGAATSPAPTPAVDCASAATSLIDCLDYVSPGSNKTRPSKTCCGEVKAAVANPALVNCLCAALGSKNLPIPIDMKRVLALPGACGASNAAFSKCNIATGAPSEAPSPSAGGPTPSSSGGATASPPVHAAASTPVTATALVAAAAAPLLAYFFLL